MKILIIGASNIGRGGRSNVIYNFSKELVKKKVIFDYVCEGKFNDSNNVRCEIADSNGLIFEEEYFETNYVIRQIKWFIRLRKILEQGEYDIVHINADIPLNALRSALIIKKFSASKVIIHAHTSAYLDNKNTIKKIVSALCKKMICRYADACVACNEEAWEFMFVNETESQAKKYIISNGVDAKKFSFNDEVRQKYRKVLDVSDKIVIGHVGNFYYPKNHLRLLSIFYDYHKKNQDSLLLLVGDGKLKKEIIEYSKELSIEDAVIILGHVDNVKDYYQVMDLFMLPSITEGMPLAGIEAQCSGLPCIFSTAISTGVQVRKNCFFVPLSEDNNIWINVIESALAQENERKKACMEIEDAGYDIKKTAEKLYAIYGGLLEYGQ